MTRGRKALLSFGVASVVIAALWLFNVRVSGPSLASAQTATQQSLDTSPGILPVMSASGHYIPMAATVSGAPIIQLANPNSSIPSNGISLAVDAGVNLVVSALQGGVATLDGGNGNQGVLFLPQLSPTTVVVTSLENPGNGQYGCSAVVEAPGGDAGVVLLQCGGTATLGADGGAASWTRLN